MVRKLYKFVEINDSDHKSAKPAAVVGFADDSENPMKLAYTLEEVPYDEDEARCVVS